MIRKLLPILICICMPLTGMSANLFIDRNTKLTEDHYGTITFTADHVTLDCAGFNVSGSQRSIEISNRVGVTVKNCEMPHLHSGGSWGIYVSNSSNIRIVDNTFQSSSVFTWGIEARNSEKLVIAGNVFTSVGFPIELRGVFDSIIEGNTPTYSARGFWIRDSHDNKFVNNMSVDGFIGFAFWGDNYNNNFKLNISCGNSVSNLHFGNGDETLDNNFRNNDFLPGDAPCP